MCGSWWPTLDAEALQFALDAPVAPARVLPGQADNQLSQVLVQRLSAPPGVRVGPGADEHPSALARRVGRCRRDCGRIVLEALAIVVRADLAESTALWSIASLNRVEKGRDHHGTINRKGLLRQLQRLRRAISHQDPARAGEQLEEAPQPIRLLWELRSARLLTAGR